MAKHTLFVCKSCHPASQERPEKPPFDGDILLDKIQTLCYAKFPDDEIEIRSVGCLWACDRGCVVSVASHDKPTYLFINLTPEESALPLMEFLQLYFDRKKGNIPWKQLPQDLQSKIFAQIPPL
jgi:predicted metal-binding protein